MIAAGQVRAPDRAAEQAIAGEDRFFVLFGKHDVSAGVSGTMPHFESQRDDLEYLAVLKKSRRPRSRLVFHPQLAHLMRLYAHKQRLLWQNVVEVHLFLVQQYFRVGKLG